MLHATHAATSDSGARIAWVPDSATERIQLKRVVTSRTSEPSLPPHSPRSTGSVQGEPGKGGRHHAGAEASQVAPGGG